MFPSAAVEPLGELAPQPAPLEIVRRFLAWTRRVEAGGRADAASALARAYLHSPLDAQAREEAELGMAALLDDPSILVRRALAEALAGSRDAPHAIILGLAGDHSEVASVVLARSPVLGDAELVDCAAIGDAAAQCAVAQRAPLGAGVCAALAEVGGLAAAIALAGNAEAHVSDAALRRLMQRFGDDAEFCETLLLRPDLPAGARCDLVAAAAKRLARFACECAWLSPDKAERVAQEAQEQGVVAIASACDVADLAALVRRLRAGGGLTVALLMRSLLCADAELFAAALVDLTALGPERVASFLRDPNGRGFASAYARSGLPAHLLPAFRAALAALRETRAPRSDEISRTLLARVIAACERPGAPDLAKMAALLRRLESEAARREAREFAREAANASVRLTRVAPTPLLLAYHAPAIDFDLLEAEICGAPDVELPLDQAA